MSDGTVAALCVAFLYMGLAMLGSTGVTIVFLCIRARNRNSELESRENYHDAQELYWSFRDDTDAIQPADNKIINQPSPKEPFECKEK